MKIIQFSCFLLFSFFLAHAEAQTLKKVYLDKQNNVHIITTQGNHQQITHENNATSIKLASDKETVAWLVMNTWIAQGDDKPGSEELIIYRYGKASSVKCVPFIRDYWFWQSGAQVVIDCGGRHFTGHEILYDTKTLKELASFDQAEVPLEKRPEWSTGDDLLR
jgi:lipopolysaccharide export system protein LptA